MCKDFFLTTLGLEPCNDTEAAGGDAGDECDQCVSHNALVDQRCQEEYRCDVERDRSDDELVLSADMRVSMLHSLSRKICMFTRRIVAYETLFSPAN